MKTLVARSPRVRLALGVIVAGLAFGAVACNKTTAPQPKVAAGNAQIPMSTTTVRAVEGVTFTFANGGAALTPALANQTITLTMSNTSSATPTTTVVAPNLVGTNGQPGRFTANTTFGSCIFTITSVTGIPGLTVGQNITVNVCQVIAQTGGVQATGNATTVQILLQLGLTPSAANQASVSIDPATGVVTVNNVNTGVSVTLTVQTGTG